MEDQAIEVLKCIQELFSDEQEENKFLTYKRNNRKIIIYTILKIYTI